MSTPDPGFPWEPWSEAAFARARAEGRLVLLHIGATWCHWCHVMDEGSYPFPGVAEVVRARFVAVRVDTDERPDVNERYNQGGWPTVAVLDPDGEVLWGRTWLPGGELLAALRGLAHAEGRWSVPPTRPAIREGAPAEPEAIRAAVDRAYDPRHAGFGDGEKFPHAPVLEWLTDRVARGEEGPARAQLAATLDAMALGGMYDHEEGGFYRYATQGDWSEPHYEKLLEDHAALLPLYLRGDALDPHPRWARAAQAAVRWALATLWRPEADAFGGSQDADEDYHRRPRSARGAPPPVDPAVYAGWNGQMVAALVRAAAAWDRPGLLGVARRVGATLRGRMDAEGRITRAGSVSGLLEDQVAVAEGWMALGSARGGEGWLDLAGRALTWARDHLRAHAGGWMDRVPEGVGLLRVARRPLPGNARLSVAATRYATLTGDPSWRTVADEAATAALIEAPDWGFMGAPAALARARADARPVLVKVHAAPELLRHALAHPHPDVHARALTADEAAAVGLPPGGAMACSDRACARPATDAEALDRSIRMLRG